MITVASLIAAGLAPARAAAFEEPLTLACRRYQIDTPLRQAAFVSQCMHESWRFARLEEDLRWTNPVRLNSFFSNVTDVDHARALIRRGPEAIANCVYAGRNGNGDEASGDGWRFRGRGLIQLTGRANYAMAALDVERPYVDAPDLLLLPPDAATSASWFWWKHQLNKLADGSQIDRITRVINGPAMVGVAERRQLFADALVAFTA